MGQSSMTETPAPGAGSPITATEVAGAPQEQTTPPAEKQAGKDVQQTAPEGQKAEGAEGEGNEPSPAEQRRKERNKQRWREMKERLASAEREVARLRSSPPPDFSRFDDPNEELVERIAHKVREGSVSEREAQLDSLRRETAQTMRAAWDEQVQAAKQHYPDWDQVWTDRVPVHERAAPFIADSDRGAEIAYRLGKDLDLASALYDLFERDPARALIKLGQIEAETSRPTSRKTSTAPRPASVLGGGQNPPAFDAHKASVDDIAAELRKAGVIR